MSQELGYELTQEQLLGHELRAEYDAAVAAAAGLHRWQVVKRIKAGWQVFKAANQESYVSVSPERPAPPVHYYPIRDKETPSSPVAEL